MGINYLEISQILIGIKLFIGGSEWLYMALNRSLQTFFDTEASMLKLQDRGFQLIIPSFEFIARILNKGKFTILLASILTGSGIFLIGTAIVETNLPNFCIPAIALVTHLIFCASVGFGLEGSDQMTSIVLFSLLIVYLIPESEQIICAFITIQLILSYGTAGLSKLFSRQWRSGKAIIMILSTRSFGLGSAHWLNANIHIAKLLCMLVMIFEISWFALPLNTSIAICLISAGFLFHLVNSVVMGLNLFLWSFAAAYPWAIYTIIALHK